MNPGDEIITIVDRDDNEVAQLPRRVMRAQGLIHRATYILVFNRQGELMVQQRTMTKDIYPGYFDVAAGGVVLAGESYELSGHRELAEELGVADVELTPHFDFYHEDDDNKVWGRVFSCITDGPFTLQKEEVAAAFFMEVDQVLALSEKESFTPDGILVLRRFLQDHA
ncbi:MAG: NUDIX hydrolase YfcD [Desulfobulbaceae bacterium]|nr:NUDIX hydrolase YfcD [Desulfobulbaceae bacterium]